MKACINESCTMKASFEEDLAAYSAAGFKAVEIWLDKVETFLEKNTIENARALLADHGLFPAGACAAMGVIFPRIQDRPKNLDHFKRCLELCAELGVPVITIPSAIDMEVKAGDYEAAIPNLKEIDSIAGDFGVTLALECIAGTRFMGSNRTAQRLIEIAGMKNAGVLFDAFHFWAGIGKSEDLEDLPSGSIAFVHVNDVPGIPREILTDAERVLPGRGVIPLGKLLGIIRDKGYNGYMSLELFNREMWELDPREAAELGMKAMKNVLGDFLE